MSFGDDETGAAWRKGLKVGDAVEVELSVGFRNLNFFRGTLANITPTGRFRVQMASVTAGSLFHSFMPDGKRVGGGYGCALLAPSAKIDEHRKRNRLTDIIRTRRNKMATGSKGLKYLSTDDLTRLAGALQLALCVSDPDRKKPKASELFCPTCLDLLEVIDEELPPEPTTTSPENSP